VCDAADQVLSTGGMCSFAASSNATEFIIGTEPGLLHRLRKENPAKRFFPMLEEAICPNMKLITLEKVRDALDRLSPRIVVDESIAKRAAISVMRMFEDGPITPVEE
jgi:quinolinate synthase